MSGGSLGAESTSSPSTAPGSLLDVTSISTLWYSHSPTRVSSKTTPDAWKGPSVLNRQRVQNVRAVHVIWALERGKQGPAVLVTAYWPDVALWSADFLGGDRDEKVHHGKSA